MILEILILALAIPAGFLLAWMSRDELVLGRVWFRALIIFSLLAGIWFFLIENKTIALTLAFIFIVTLISYVKSFEKN
jgi:hypothetical protein